MILRGLLFATALVATPALLMADTLKFSFTGGVESVNDSANANLSGGLGPYNIGDALSGMFTLNTDLLTGGSGSQASYINAVDSLSVTIDGNSYSSTGPGSLSVFNNVNSRDLIIADFSVSGPAAGGLPVANFQFSLGGTNAVSVLSDVSGPTIAQFIALFNNDNNDGNTKFFEFTDTVNGGFADVRYDVTSLTIETVNAVPLPAGAFLFLSGLGGLAIARRRKKTAT